MNKRWHVHDLQVGLGGGAKLGAVPRFTSAADAVEAFQKHAMTRRLL